MEYEIFLDSSYYDTWCVRPKGSTEFNDPRNWHFDTEEEAREYKEMVEQEEKEGKKMKNTMEDLLQTIEENAVDNTLTITDVKLFVKSWREEAEIFGQKGCPCCKTKEVVTDGYRNVCGAGV